MDLEGLQRASGVRGGESEGVSNLGTQFRVLSALCPNANYLKVTRVRVQRTVNHLARLPICWVPARHQGAEGNSQDVL